MLNIHSTKQFHHSFSMTFDMTVMMMCSSDDEFGY